MRTLAMRVVLAGWLTTFASGCVATSIVELGAGRYMAVLEQTGGISGEAERIELVRAAAAERCGGVHNLRVVSVERSNGHGGPAMHFECVRRPADLPRGVNSVPREGRAVRL